MKKSVKRFDPKNPRSEPDKSIPASLDEALINEFCHIMAGIIRRIVNNEAKNPGINKKNKAPVNKKLEKPS